MNRRVRVESATVRPFRNLDAISEHFERHVAARIGSTRLEPAPLPNFFETDLLQSDEEDLNISFVSSDASAPIGSVAEQLMAATIGVGSKDLIRHLRLVVAIRSMSLRFSAVLGSWSLQDEIPSVLSFSRGIDPARLALQDRAGFDVRIALVLATDLDDAPALTPSLAGTWLAQSRFRVRSQPNRGGFAPQELTPEVRRQYGIPDATLSFVAIHRESLLASDDLSEVATHYWDPEVLQLVQIRPKDDIARFVQESMAIELLTALASAIGQTVRTESGQGLSLESLNDYPAARDFLEELADMLNTGTGADRTPSDVLRLASDDLPTLRALIEGEFNVKKSLIDTLRNYQ